MKKILTFSTILIFIILGLDFFTKSGIYIFLDTIFSPVYELKGFFSQSIYWHLRDIMTIIFGYMIYSKIFMLFVLITGIFLGLKISFLITKLLDIKSKKLIFFYEALSIVFVLFNPFIYERLVTQTGIALGVFFIGLGFIYLLEFLLYKKEKNLYLAGLFLGISFTIFPHSIVFIFIISIFSLLFYYKSFSIKKILFSIFIIFIINSNWLLGSFILNTNNTTKTIQSFNQTNIEVFKSNSLSNLGVEITNLLGYGFWGEKYRHLYTPDLVNNKWYISGFIILFIIFLGFIFLYKKNKKLSIYLMFIAIFSYILSLGISLKLFAGINAFLYNNIPYYIGMREPGKLLGLVSIIYTIYFLFGINGIYQLSKKYKINKYLPKKINFWLISTLLLILAWSPNMLFGFNGQLKIINYPIDYIKVRDILLKNNYGEKSIILPWHSYMGCSWTYGKIIANPLPYMLKPNNIISADNIEIGSLYTNSRNPQSKKIEQFLKEKNFNILKKLGINNIIYQKSCADFKNYKYLEDNKNLKKIYSGSSLNIYKIK